MKVCRNPACSHPLMPDDAEACGACGSPNLYPAEGELQRAEPIEADAQQSDDADESGSAEPRASRWRGKTISVIGFPTSGKSFLIQRVKYIANHFWEKNGYLLDPPYVTPDKIDTTQQSDPDLEHRFIATRGWRRFNFRLLDISGEDFRIAAATNFVGGDTEVLRRVLASDAMILVLPADLTLFHQFEPHKSKSQKNLAELESFNQAIIRLAIVTELARAGWSRDQLATLSPERIQAMLEDREVAACGMPLFVALAKADDLAKTPKLAAGLQKKMGLGSLDEDPYGVMHNQRSKLAGELPAAFRHCKIDFVSAYVGHPGGLKVHEALEHHGVEGMMHWLKWALGRTRLRRRAITLEERNDRRRAKWATDLGHAATDWHDVVTSTQGAYHLRSRRQWGSRWRSGL